MTGQAAPPLRVLVCGVLALALVLGAYVALSIAGIDTGPLFAALLPLLGVLGLAGHVEARTRQQNDQLGTIETQTNGQLTLRIRNESRKAMREVMTEAGFDVHPVDESQPRRPIEAP